MQVAIKTSELLKGLRWVSGAADRKSTSPVLQNMLISTSGKDVVEVTATDLTMVTTGKLAATVEKPGAVVINARRILEIAGALPEGEVALEKLENNGLMLRCGKIEYKLVGMRAEEFPRVAKPAGTRLFRVNRDVLAGMISKTIYAIATDDVRRNLSGVCIDSAEGGRVRMVSTDGHRLAIAEAELSGSAELRFPGIIVPRKGITEIKRILDDVGEEAELGVLQNQIILSTPDVTLSTKLIDGKFPDYMQVLPKDNERLLIASRTAIINALRRIAIFSTNNSIVILKFRKDALTITSTSPDAGEAREDLDVSYAGPAMEVAINSKYLVEAFGVMDSESVRLEMKDELSAIRLAAAAGEGYACVVMPVRQ